MANLHSRVIIWSMANSSKALFNSKFAVSNTGYPSDCWLWVSRLNNKGYGCWQLDGKAIYAHRASWVLYRGKIPDGLFVLHKCDQPKCVRPDHLFLGTALDNSRDMYSKGRQKIARGENCVRSKLKESDVIEIRRLANQGLSYPSIASQFGTSDTNVHRIAAHLNWKHIGGGAFKPRLKISQDQRLKIKSLFSSGVRQTVIAESFGINQSHVSRIIRDKVSRH